MRRANKILHKTRDRIEPQRCVTGDCTLWPRELKHGHHVIGLEDWEHYDRGHTPSSDF